MSADIQRGRARLKPSGSGGAGPPQRSWSRAGWLFLVFVVSLFVLNYWTANRVTQQPLRVRIPYSPVFLEQVRANNVKEIRSKGGSIQGTFVSQVRYPPSHGRTAREFTTLIPSFADTNALSELLQSHQVVINAEPLDTGLSWWQNLLYGFGPTILFLVLLVLVMRRFGRGANVLGSFGRSRARRYQPTSTRVTFADVAGIDEAKAELAEIVDFLRQPERYRRLGGRIPRGVLLSGPPGTGKTLLARAVAGEADVPFFSMSASEFIEAIVGVGASRVRDLFAQAKAAAPAIIFIDELDAIGRSRAGNVSGFGAGDEREQTLNQILTEMDGFDSGTGVIVIAATNRPDVLDQALLRPGRFDRRVTVLPPDRGGRQAILEVHTRGVPLALDVDLGRVAQSTPGMVGADLANLVNEAALLAASRGREEVSAADLGDALEKIVLGAARKVMMSEEDRRRTAYHEAGHAIVGMLTIDADPVRKVSIIPRGLALGVTFSAPDADRYNYERIELIARIKVALGGRVAEELVLGEPTTGAESDIVQLTEIGRQMVGRWGMSDVIGPIAVVQTDGRGPWSPSAGETSPRTQELVDEEVRRIVDQAHEEVTALLIEHRDKLDALAQALLRRETLDEEEAYAAAGIERRDRDDSAADTVAARI